MIVAFFVLVPKIFAALASATPRNGHPASFTALLEMIDSRRFSRGALLDERALREVTVPRLKSDLPEKGFKQRASGHPVHRTSG